jgi:broad specificity phosphatase PhoE
VAHGGTIRALLHAAMGVPLEKTFDFSVDYGSISILNFKHGRFSLQKWNN